jgi:hypothetical protein
LIYILSMIKEVPGIARLPMSLALGIAISNPS